MMNFIKLHYYCCVTLLKVLVTQVYFIEYSSIGEVLFEEYFVHILLEERNYYQVLVVLGDT